MKSASILEYFKTNKKLFGGLAVFTIIFSLIRLLFPTISYDTDEWLISPDSTLPHWLGIGRYSLVILKTIFPAGNLFIINAVTCLNTWVYSILFLYFFQLNNGRPFSKSGTLLCGMFLISSPIFLEQYYFTLQSAEVSLGMVLIALSSIAAYNLLASGRIHYGILTILLLTFTFGIYQAFVNLYIADAIIICYKRHENYLRNELKNILLTFCIFAVSLLFYEGISNYLIYHSGIPACDYLESAWKTEPILSCIIQIIISFGKVILGYKTLNLSFDFCAVCVLYHIIKKRPHITWKHFYLCALLLSPFVLNIVTAASLVIRSALSLPIVCAYLFHEYYSSSKLMRSALYAVIFSQFIQGQLLLYGDYIRNKNDIAISQKIYKDCKAGSDTTIVMKGMYHPDEEQFILQGQAIGHSFYEWTADGQNVDNNRIRYFMLLNACPYTAPSAEELSAIDSIEFTAKYPQPGYIIEKDNIFYVNLGE